MNIQVKPGRIVPQDHIEYLVSRYGWRKVAYIVLTYALRRRRLGLRPQRAAALAQPPDSTHLRRDIGLPPTDKAASRYWDLR